MNKNNITLKISAGRRDQLIRDGKCQIAFSGRSNVGKSSALNRLLGRKKLARVSSSPGKTVTINFFHLDNKCYLVDLPGYGFARRSESEKRAWSNLTDSYFQDHEHLALVLQLIDLKTGPSRDDETMIAFLQEVGIPFVIVATKVDKLNKTDRRAALEKIAAHPLVSESTVIIPFSSHTGEGKTELWKEILKFTDL